jgi:hypothetical protein
MSNRYKGGVISATPPTTTGGNDGVASGAWTLEQQMQAQAAGLWPNQPVFYIEDVFQTWLYTGNGTSQTITNGINLSGKGGLVWIKNRAATWGHVLSNTVAGIPNSLNSNNTNAQDTGTTYVSAFSTTGFSVADGVPVNANNQGIVSWTFREQPKFFDIVTYTGNGVDNRDIPHSLGSTPGCIIVKCTNSTPAWRVWHTSLTAGNNMELNATDGQFADTSIKSCTDTTFRTNSGSNSNGAGNSYVAYLFAHNAGGFGATETDNVISCGSFTTDGSGNATVNLGYEPQWAMMKRADDTGSWVMVDNMRTWNTDGFSQLLANTSGAEAAGPFSGLRVNSTGFTCNGGFPAAATIIYIAIRRGPMKVPTDGTKVFSPNASSGSTGTALVTNFPVDLSISTVRSGDTRYVSDRLRGVNSPGLTANRPWLATDSTGAELTNASIPRGWDNTQILVPPYYSGASNIWWNFRRAPGFFDEVCYTGTGVARTVAHNLTVAPELMLIKVRTPTGYAWRVYAAPLGVTQSLRLNTDNASETDTYWNGTAPTSTVFSVNDYGQVNNSGSPIVAYLFATCPGVSKVGSYTGTGTTQTINCGFTAGSRFVLIKRTDNTGDWYVWDSARGIIPSDDPYLLLNSTAAEVTNTDYVDTAATGFEITSTAPAAINASGGTFIFLAIA